MSAIPTGYDAVLLNHWLWYKYRCNEASPSDFQILFENIIKRVNPEFMSVRPYGNIGDRKCDGLFFADKASTVFQVYAPDNFHQDELIHKINEDLKGAVLHWRDSLKHWVFVYNVRRGLPPDVARLLVSKGSEYSQIKLEHWSSDALWEMVRTMPLQKRAEILGAPSGYEHLFFSSLTTNEDINRHLDSGSFILVQDILAPIGLRAVSDALAPATPFGAPFFIRPTYDLSWTDAAMQQKQMVQSVLEKGRDLVPRFSVFSLAPIPLAVHLGFLLSDRVEARYFQYDRELNTWKWPLSKRKRVDVNINVDGLPDSPIQGEVEVSISISLSSPISKADTEEVAPNSVSHISISVPDPDVMWLRSPKQIQELARVLRQTLKAIRTNVQRCTAIHIFYAGPTAGAVLLGQVINPRMNPPVHIYQYSQQSSPRYSLALTLTETLGL